MREILFRGKRIDNGEWVEGLLSQTTVIASNKPAYVALTIDELGKKPFVGCWHEVDPDTVGQYTGLTANGKRVFEGDILRNVITTNGEVVTGVVSYADGAFGVKSNRGGIFLAFFENCEIIGNIHDNPELMKGENTNG